MHQFFVYDAKHLAIDAERPWQICTVMGCLVGKFKSRENADRALVALEEDFVKGILPINLTTWSKVHLLSD